MKDRSTRAFFDSVASQRRAWRARNRYYNEDIERFVSSNIHPEDTVLEIGCGPGDLLASLPVRIAVGVDFSEAMIRSARQKYPSCFFLVSDAEDLSLNYAFDYVILSDTIGFLSDVQRAFEQLKRVTKPTSRIVITYYNYLWEPFLKVLEILGFKMKLPIQNWLPLEDIQNLLSLSGFEVVKKGYRLLLPKQIPWISTFLNRFAAKMPLIRKLCLVEWVIAKPIGIPQKTDSFSCSVVIPCRNERGNIVDLVERTPEMGRSTELIFVDGSSTDGTLEEIERMKKAHPGRTIRLIHQGGAKGKGNAVHQGLEAAEGDILMILDADLTVAPEDLPKFFNALVEGKGEFINGTRMVYPMEKEAMRFLNILGNNFFKHAFSYLLDQRFTDTLCGTKALWRKSYVRICEGRAYFGDFDPFGDYDLIFGASKQNLQIVELPVRYRERTYGVTKIKRFTHGWLLFKMCWFAMKKLKFV